VYPINPPVFVAFIQIHVSVVESPKVLLEFILILENIIHGVDIFGYVISMGTAQ